MARMVMATDQPTPVNAPRAAGTSKGGQRPRVVIVGSGFGGLFAAKHLRRSDVDVTIVAETPNHLFQPLLYQVATGILSEGLIPNPRDRC